MEVWISRLGRSFQVNLWADDESPLLHRRRRAAGMMLGYLLGRAGIDVVVLEKHADFFRDFRGDTVHPSTLQVMDELGLIDGFLKLPHQRLQTMDGMFGGPRCGSPISAGCT